MYYVYLSTGFITVLILLLFFISFCIGLYRFMYTQSKTKLIVDIISNGLSVVLHKDISKDCAVSVTSIIIVMCVNYLAYYVGIYTEVITISMYAFLDICFLYYLLREYKFKKM